MLSGIMGCVFHVCFDLYSVSGVVISVYVCGVVCVLNGVCFLHMGVICYVVYWVCGVL